MAKGQCDDSLLMLDQHFVSKYEGARKVGMVDAGTVGSFLDWLR